jgi:hypothetical protein
MPISAIEQPICAYEFGVLGTFSCATSVRWEGTRDFTQLCYEITARYDRIRLNFIHHYAGRGPTVDRASVAGRTRVPGPPGTAGRGGTEGAHRRMRVSLLAVLSSQFVRSVSCREAGALGTTHVSYTSVAARAYAWTRARLASSCSSCPAMC